MKKKTQTKAKIGGSNQRVVSHREPDFPQCPEARGLFALRLPWLNGVVNASKRLDRICDEL